MNDVQLALLITGVAIIFVLIIYNWSELKRLTKKNKTFEMVGCTPAELKIYLEKNDII